MTRCIIHYEAGLRRLVVCAPPDISGFSLATPGPRVLLNADRLAEVFFARAVGRDWRLTMVAGQIRFADPQKATRGWTTPDVSRNLGYRGEHMRNRETDRGSAKCIAHTLFQQVWGMMPEPDLFFISVSLRVAITGLFVLSMGWIIAHASPKLAAVAIAMPVVIGSGFLILALERERDFILRAAEDSLGALAGTVAFAVTVAVLAGRAGRSIVLVAALVVWFLMVSLTGLANGVYDNLAAFASVYLTGLWILRAPAQGTRGPGYWSVRAELPRAAAAGLLVGLVTVGAERLGPTLSGTLIALPVGMLFVASGVLNAADGYRARVVLSAGARGSAALALFLIVVQVLLIYGMMPVPTVLLATLASVLAALGLGLMVRVTLVASAKSPDGQP